MNEIKDIDILLEIAQEELETPEVKHESCFNEATRYILAKNIEGGDHRIPPPAIWDSYRNWKKTINEDIDIPENIFYKQLAKLFKRKKVKGYNFYLLNSLDFDLSSDNLERLRKEKIYAERTNTKKTNRKKEYEEIKKEFEKKPD